MQMQKTDEAYNWRRLQWPFVVTFCYYGIISLYTGVAPADEAGFLSILALALITDACVYFLYRFFSREKKENMPKLWLLFAVAYAVLTREQLGIAFKMLTERF